MGFNQTTLRAAAASKAKQTPSRVGFLSSVPEKPPLFENESQDTERPGVPSLVPIN